MSKGMPSYDFRNYLFKAGLLNYSDFPKIYEDPSNPNSLIISLTSHLQDIFNSDFNDIAENIYSGWVQNQKECAARKIVFMKRRISVRECNTSFGIWKKISQNFELEQQFKKMKEYIVRLLKENKNLQQNQRKPRNSEPEIHQSYFQKKAAMSLLESSSKQVSSSVFKEFPTTGSLDLNIISDKDKEKSELFTRLYEEAAKKREVLEKVQEQFKDKDLVECTFKPDIYSNTQPNISVFERLQMSDKKLKEDFYKLKREEKELSECTFKPRVNSIRSSKSEHSFEKLYKDAEVQRQKQRTKEIIEKDKELENCTFKPSVSVMSRKSEDEPPIYIKLYNSYQDHQKEQRKKELEKKIEEEKNHPFTPKLMTPKRESSGTPVHERLYSEKEKREEKLKKQREEQEKEFEKARHGSVPRGESDEVPRYENLYQNFKEIQDKKVVLKEKFMKDAGISFKPDMTKSNNSFQANSRRSSRPQTPSKQIDQGNKSSESGRNEEREPYSK
ncbi:unnamed protein product [Blepharisma stoltei]|uniref:Uncharacterized protein n=1 Tax=Blepharisma stoltei TaxID=1481888 RepID=A0AAU9IC94_9CILI|nr:unnamed protein product [Blepharisma stoltei]